MAEYQISGEKNQLGKSPVASPSANPGSGQFQTTGERVNLGRNPVQSPSANPGSGEYQCSGEKVAMNRNPVKGLGSAGTLPMSPRALTQSKVSTGGGKTKKY